MKIKTNQQGQTLKGILVLFACIAIIGVASINVYFRLMERAKVVNLINQTAMIINSTYALYKGHPPYDGLNNSIAVLQKLVPADMIDGKEKIKHAFKGEVILRALNSQQGFTLIYRNLPTTACRMLAETNWGNEDSGLKYLFASPTKHKIPKNFPKKLLDNEYHISQLPLSHEEAVSACKCKRNDCSITFIYQ